MSVTAKLNASNSQTVVTDNGACLPIDNQIVNFALLLINTGGSALTIQDVSQQTQRPSYGAIADALYDSLVGQTVPATGAVLLQWQEAYSNAGPAIGYGKDLILQMSDGTNVTPAPAPGFVNLALSTVIATNVVWVNGIKFQATAHNTGNINGVGAPLFDLGTNDTGTAVNLAAAVNQIFGAGSATPSTTNVVMAPPVIGASNASGTITVTSGSTITVGAGYAAGDVIQITGRQTTAKGGNLQTYQFTATSNSAQTGGTGAPLFYIGASATEYATNLTAAIVALFGTSTASSSGAVITTGATLAANDFGIGAGLATSAPTLTVAAGTNVVSPQPVIFQLAPGTAVPTI